MSTLTCGRFNSRGKPCKAKGIKWCITDKDKISPRCYHHRWYFLNFDTKEEAQIELLRRQL